MIKTIIVDWKQQERWTIDTFTCWQLVNKAGSVLGEIYHEDGTEVYQGQLLKQGKRELKNFHSLELAQKWIEQEVGVEKTTKIACTSEECIYEYLGKCEVENIILYPQENNIFRCNNWNPGTEKANR